MTMKIKMLCRLPFYYFTPILHLTIDFAQRVEKVQAVLQNLIQFCQRNSGKVEERNKQVHVYGAEDCRDTKIYTFCRQCGFLYLIWFKACNTEEQSMSNCQKVRAFWFLF